MPETIQLDQEEITRDAETMCDELARLAPLIAEMQRRVPGLTRTDVLSLMIWCNLDSGPELEPWQG